MLVTGRTSITPVTEKKLVDRPGKQPDGSSKTREIKLVRIWSAEERDKESTPVRDATGRGFERAARRAVLGDGAIWIWEINSF